MHAGHGGALTPKLPQTKMKGNAGSHPKMGTYISWFAHYELAGLTLCKPASTARANSKQEHCILGLSGV
jgi:hypothetical protein